MTNVRPKAYRRHVLCSCEPVAGPHFGVHSCNMPLMSPQDARPVGTGHPLETCSLMEVAGHYACTPMDQYHSAYQAPVCLLSPRHVARVIRVSGSYLVFMG